MLSQITRILVCLGACASISWAHERPSPREDWRRFETKHFRFHYAKPIEPFARVFSECLEKNYSEITESFRWRLDGRAEVFVDADHDAPGGQSEVFPHRRIRVRAAPFSLTSTIGESDDWIEQLCIHELVHLVSNDTTGGFFNVLRKIFGATAKVNQLLAPWLMEGFAVAHEIPGTKGGRTESTWGRAIFRVAARDQLLRDALFSEGATPRAFGSPEFHWTEDRLNLGPRGWPAESFPYWMGAPLLSEAHKENGKSAGVLSAESARRVPFFLEQEILRSERDGKTLWLRVLEKITAQANAELGRIRARPITGVQVLREAVEEFEASAGWSGGAVIDAQGREAFWVRDGFADGEGLSAVTIGENGTPAGPPRALSVWRWGGSRRLSPTPDSRQLLYSRIERFDQYRFYSDVFVWDVEQGRELRLTQGERALDPDVSPDFKWGQGRLLSGAFTYVRNLPDGNQALVVRDGVQARELWRGKRYERLDHPAWGKGKSRDWIAASLKERGPMPRRLVLWNPLQARRCDLSWIKGDSLTPAWDSGGGLWFANNQDGVFNLFRLDFDAQSCSGGLVKKTNLESGAWFPYPGKKIYASVLTARGFEPSRVDASDEPVALERKTEKPLDRSEGASAVAAVRIEEDPEAAGIEPEDGVSPFPALWPKYWYPFGRLSTDGLILGARTGGADALRLHRYFLEGAWDSRADFPLYRAEYRFEGLYPTLRLEREQENKYIAVSEQSNAVVTSRLGMDFPIGLGWVGFGGVLSRSSFFTSETESAGLEFSTGIDARYRLPGAIDADGDRGFLGEATASGFLVGDEPFSSVFVAAEQRVPIGSGAFLRFSAQGARSSNRNLSASFFVGGEDTTIERNSRFLLRGYPIGAIFGRSIVVAHAEVWASVWSPHRGLGRMPVFLRRMKVRGAGDVGSAEFIAGSAAQFKRWPAGIAGQLLGDLTLFHRWPVTLGLGLSRGLDASMGGETRLTLGFWSDSAEFFD